MISLGRDRSVSFLALCFFFCCFLCSLLSLALVLLGDLELAESFENSGVSHLLCDLLGSNSLLRSGLCEDVLSEILLSSLSGLELIGGGVSDVSLLWLISSSWEENKLALVIFKSLDVELKSFF